MTEILSESVRLVNLPFTVLLGCVIVYWLLMAVGLVDFDTHLDLDLHADADIDAAADVDASADGHADTDPGAHGAAGFFGSVLQFLNIGEVPLMVVLSVMTLSMWMLSMIANHYWGDGSLLRAGLFLLPNLLITAVLTHFFTRPLRTFFKALNREYDEHIPIIGRTCTIITSEVTPNFGQAQIETRGAPIVINVRTSGDAVLRKGETGLVIREDKAGNIYNIIKVTTDKLET